MRNRSRSRSLPQRVAIGAAAGLGATFAMQGMMAASGKLIPGSAPPIRQDPGEFMLDKATAALPDETNAKIPENVRKGAAKSLHLGYGMTSGALYGVLGQWTGSPVVDGALLGLGVWAAGYLGWLPASDLMPPITEHTPRQIAVPVVQHALFGMVVVAAYSAMTRTRKTVGAS